MKRPTTNSRHPIASHAFYFFLFSSFFNHCYFLQNPSKPNWRESLYTFYDCHVSIVRTVAEHSERSKALTHPDMFLLSAAKGAQNLNWAPRPFPYTADFLQVRCWCIPLHQSLCCHAVRCKCVGKLQVVVIFLFGINWLCKSVAHLTTLDPSKDLQVYLFSPMCRLQRSGEAVEHQRQAPDIL